MGMLQVRYEALEMKAAGVLALPSKWQHAHVEEKLALYNEKDLTIVSLLKRCTELKDLCKGSILHADALRKGSFTGDFRTGKSLLYMYAKCGSIAKAQQVFDELPIHDVASWTSLLAGYVEMGHAYKAFDCFERMQHEGHSPDGVAFASILKACIAIGTSERGAELHDQIMSKGILGNNLILGSALVDMYAKLGNLNRARQVLDELPVRNVVTWNALITGYCQHGRGKEVLHCFEQMKREGIRPSAVTFACTLKACGSMRTIEKGKQLHAEIITKGMLINNNVLGSALMDMYAKCGALTKAQQIFDDLPEQDVISWTSLITGCCQHGFGEEALSCLEKMRHWGFSPNAMTFACVLKVCGSIGAVQKGKELHAEIIRSGLLCHDVVLGNALVYMYAKCGILSKAQDVFDELPVRSIVSWSTLITGYCEEGHGQEALMCFELMRHEGLPPDGIVFSSVLKACSTIGATEKGQTFYESMGTKYGIIPSYEHHVCLVDLLCRNGHFEQAVMMIEKMPSTNHFPVWFALLGACRKWGTPRFGKVAFGHAIGSDGKPCRVADVSSTENVNKIEEQRS